MSETTDESSRSAELWRQIHGDTWRVSGQGQVFWKLNCYRKIYLKISVRKTFLYFTIKALKKSQSQVQARYQRGFIFGLLCWLIDVRSPTLVCIVSRMLWLLLSTVDFCMDFRPLWLCSKLQPVGAPFPVNVEKPASLLVMRLLTTEQVTAPFLPWPLTLLLRSSTYVSSDFFLIFSYFKFSYFNCYISIKW